MIDAESGEVIVPFVRTKWNYDPNKVSRETGLCCTDATRTQQQFKAECDINTIVEQFGITGEMPSGVRVPNVLEFTEVVDYQSALNKLMEAEASFMQYPAQLRAQFENDPGKFVLFVSDPKNKAKVDEWGLGKPPVVSVAPLAVRVVADPAVPPSSGSGPAST